jgi:predicted  nucleic acid-binding Zn-ribbon protein
MPHSSVSTSSPDANMAIKSEAKPHDRKDSLESGLRSKDRLITRHKHCQRRGHIVEEYSSIITATCHTCGELDHIQEHYLQQEQNDRIPATAEQDLEDQLLQTQKELHETRSELHQLRNELGQDRQEFQRALGRMDKIVMGKCCPLRYKYRTDQQTQHSVSSLYTT